MFFHNEDKKKQEQLTDEMETLVIDKSFGFDNCLAWRRLSCGHRSRHDQFRWLELASLDKIACMTRLVLELVTRPLLFPRLVAKNVYWQDRPYKTF